MDEPISVSLSQLLVAYLIETDNAAETWLPHRTSAFGEGGPPSPAPRNGHSFRRPWLVSVVSWQNLLRILRLDGLPHSLARRAPANVEGLRAWGYARLEGERLVLTWGGKYAYRVWSELEPAIDRRWRDRFGDQAIDELRGALEPFAAGVTDTTPRSLPQLAFATGALARFPAELGPGAPIPPGQLGVDVLLTRALLCTTVGYERVAQFPAALGFDVLEHLADADGELTRTELVTRSGIAADTLTSMVGRLARDGAVLERRVDRSVVYALTRLGAEAVEQHDGAALAGDAALAEAAGAEASARLAAALAAVRGDVDGLRQTLEPPEGTWRSRPPFAARTEALLADPLAGLPRQPVVTHRGGFPDGS